MVCQVATETEGNIALSAHTANVGLALLFLASTANTEGSRQLRQPTHPFFAVIDPLTKRHKLEFKR